MKEGSIDVEHHNSSLWIQEVRSRYRAGATDSRIYTSVAQGPVLALRILPKGMAPLTASPTLRFPHPLPLYVAQGRLSPIRQA
jgi:hypothetical protein